LAMIALPRLSAPRLGWGGRRTPTGKPAAALRFATALSVSGAMQRGPALGAGFAYPGTLHLVARWAGSLSGLGFQLAPASALAPHR
jgi:hypothetical protein